MLFGELIKSLVGKAGINPDDETLKKILAFQDQATIDLPEEFYKPLEENLLTAESAVANGKVRQQLYAEALNGLDTEINNSVHELPFDDTFKSQIKGIQKNTHEKTRQLIGGTKKLIADLSEQVKQAKKNPKTEESQKEIENLNKVIESLNREMDNIKVMHKGEVENMKMQGVNDRRKFVLRSSLSGKPLPKNQLPPEVNIKLAETLINEAMAKNGLTIIFDEFDNPILKQRKDGAEIDYFVDNKKVDYNGFVDRTLADNKFVQINDQQHQNGNSGNGTGNNGTATAGAGPRNQQIADETQKMIDSMGMRV